MVKTSPNQTQGSKDFSKGDSGTDSKQVFGANRSDSTTQPDIDRENAKPESIFGKLKAKTTAILVSSAVMLPILAVGTVTYYFGNSVLNEQTILAKRNNDLDLIESLAKQQKLLTALLIGTGITAWVAGTTAAFGTKRLLDEIAQSQSQTVTDSGDLEADLDSSASQGKILQAVVAEARTYLNCDRAIVYSLNKDNYGVIVAESVADDYISALGKSNKDPGWEIELDKYCNGTTAIALMATADMTTPEELSVKALVAPIVNQKLFGLLVAHQYNPPKEWQQPEIKFLRQLGKRSGLAIENANLCEDINSLRTEVERERKWTHYFSDTVKYIRQSIQHDNILEISTEEVQRTLSCDRAIVYSLEDDRVIAESVSPGYPKALNRKIEDLETEYLNKHRHGFRAIDNIYEAEISQHYIQQLENLKVKANLVTPILNQGKLFGLLVAHQCDATRHWQDYEIRWMIQIATQVGFALDNAAILAEITNKQLQLETERKWTHYFTDAVGYIRESIQQDRILETSVEEVKRVLNCDRVVIYNIQDNQGKVIAESVSAGYSRALGETIKDPFETSLDCRDGVKAINNIYEAGVKGYYIQQLETLEVKANLVAPILNQGKPFGLLVAHQCDAPRHWLNYEIRWMRQIAIQIGLALDNATLLNKLRSDDLPTQLLNNFSFSISEKIDRAELLEIAVEQIREIIKLDRAMIYQFDDHGGNVVAESVVPGYPQGLNPSEFFASQYEKSSQIEVKAIADIDRADLNNYELEQLKLLSVKASLTVPIGQNEQLLLIGHQCQQPHLWSQLEIDLFTQLALQLAQALDRVKLQQELELIEDIQAELDLTIPKAIEPIDIEVLQPLSNLPQTIVINDPSTLIKPFVPTQHITVEAQKIIESVPLGQLVKSDLDNNAILLNRFDGEITNLSERVTQQSLFVTESFQKLAAFAKELSEKEK